jgi:cation:H+ antiporter
MEVIFAISLTLVAIAGTIVPSDKNIFNINPFSIVIVGLWFLGIVIINRARKIKRLNQTDAEASPGRHHHERRKRHNHPFYAKKSNFYVIAIFVFGCLATLAAGVILERSGSAIAGQLGINAGIFAATAIAFVASLPELSIGIESIFIGDNHLAISDIMGGNAFMLNIFLITDIVAQKPILSFSQTEDIFFAWLGILMMGVYGLAFIIKSKKSYFGLGLDSIAQVFIYIAGIATLGFIK